MADTIKKEKIRIRYEGIFDWEKLYSTISGWCKTKHFDYYEERNVKKPEAYGYEKEFRALAEREESGYVIHSIRISLHGHHMEDSESSDNGEKKIKTKTSMMTIDFEPFIELDWQHRWDKKFKKKARDFFHKHMLKGFIEEQLDKITYEAYLLHEAVKDVLGMTK